ncbi:hypothetical protein AVO44_17000 [Ruegeria profundi]|uniref:Uncharacterized protein n=1 Tax=Ruegeria profundi TaxID=1685378 RepID=A0A0X3TPC7_9RHOB|nr:hypothetical protein AVO44_17000 [Ruegeria profundi]
MNQANDLLIDQDVEQPSPELVRQALRGVVSSVEFRTSPRLQQFLTYIVEETLAGRGAQIRGKAIAVEVYGRSIDGSGGRNLVRVEARRLRRLLREFYEEHWDGKGVRIFVDPGGYKPRFSYEPSGEDPNSDPRTRSQTRESRHLRQLLLIGLAVLAVIAVLGTWLITGNREVQESSNSTQQAKRAALGQHSLARLQAANLADQARGMFFPVFDVKRQQIALGMFQHATELDPALPDGYAGSAQVLATLALLSRDEENRDDLLLQALEMSGMALDLSPSGAWANASNGWRLAVSNEPDEALKYARLSAELAPKDGHVLDLVGITALIANMPALAAEVSNPARSRAGSGRFGARNIWGVSQLMLGNYENVVEAFQGAPAAGAPVSAPSLIFQAAAHDQLGNFNEAQRLIGELQKTWPEFPSEFLVERIFPSDQKTRETVLGALSRY